MLTAEAINLDAAKVIRKARNRLRSVGRRFRDVRVQDDSSFVAFLSRRNGVACWFHAQREPQLHAIAQQFEAIFEPSEERTAVISDALRVW